MTRSLRILLGVAAVSAACLFVANAASVGTGARFKGPIGLQLCSLRAEFTRNVPSTIQKVKSMGIRNVELAGSYNLSTDCFKQMLTDAGLRAISGHFPYDRYKNDPEGVAKHAKALSLDYAGCAWIPQSLKCLEQVSS